MLAFDFDKWHQPQLFLLKGTLKFLSLFGCIAALSAGESFSASAQKLRVLIYEANTISLKAYK